MKLRFRTDDRRPKTEEDFLPADWHKISDQFSYKNQTSIRYNHRRTKLTIIGWDRFQFNHRKESNDFINGLGKSDICGLGDI